MSRCKAILYVHELQWLQFSIVSSYPVLLQLLSSVWPSVVPFIGTFHRFTVLLSYNNGVAVSNLHSLHKSLLSFHFIFMLQHSEPRLASQRSIFATHPEPQALLPGARPRVRRQVSHAASRPANPPQQAAGTSPGTMLLALLDQYCGRSGCSAQPAQPA